MLKQEEAVEDIHQYQYTGIGSTTWTSFQNDKGSGPIWARTAQSGDYLYIIGNYSDSNVIKTALKQPFVIFPL
jgi:hypothetical protein